MSISRWHLTSVVLREDLALDSAMMVSVDAVSNIVDSERVEMSVMCPDTLIGATAAIY